MELHRRADTPEDYLDYFVRVLSRVSELLGPDPSVRALGQMIAERAAGNPFFAEEIVRELAERGVLHGERGAYESVADVAEARVPAALQATIAARIDRLDPKAKRTLSAAAVIGSRFSRGLLETLGMDPTLEDLLGGADRSDQVHRTTRVCVSPPADSESHFRGALSSGGQSFSNSYFPRSKALLLL